MARLSLIQTHPISALLALLVAGLAYPLLLSTFARAATPEQPDTAQPSWVGQVVGKLQTTADALAWSDERVVGDWRVQRRAGTTAGRILDPADHQVAEGSLTDCLKRFSRLQAEGQIPPVTGDTIILLHGLGEGRTAMKPLSTHLRQSLDATVMSFGYASPRVGLAAHADSLAAVIAGLPKVTSISFVGHSMGNLVVRRWLHQATPESRGRIRRMVMLGPPNQGSELARLAAGNHLLTALAAGAARELVLHWETIAKDLNTPTFEYGIIAGGKGDGRGYSPVLEGDDDAVVRVAETRLDGADDFLVLPVRHSRMMDHPEVQRATLLFLKFGRFTADTQTSRGTLE